MRLPDASQTAYRGEFIQVDVERWAEIGRYEVVKRRDAAAVLPITPDGDVILVKQFRPPIRQELTEIPAGLLDIEGEDVLTCAARELLEETGYRHEAIEFLGGFYSSAGSSDEYVHLFVARTGPEPVGEPEAGIEVLRLPFDRMVAAARAGKVRDAKTAIALLMARGE